MFLGEFQHNLDEKGRLIIPARLREGLGSRFVMTKGLDRCLFLYPLGEWNSLEEKLKALPFVNPEARAFVRLFFAGAAEGEFDRQGRVLIPPSLREYAALEREATVIGVSTRVEIWNTRLWQEYTRKAQADYESLAEKLGAL
ncbi:MAG: division/cell wall cluster transcriptional repressor MraZ [Moorellales bacterium]